MEQTKPIKTTKYLNPTEIMQQLTKVEYILMAAPAPENFQDTPIHFTIFLNTQTELPENIKKVVLQKF